MIYEFLELISTGKPYFPAINAIYTLIDSSPVVKALDKVAHSQVRAAFEALKEEKYL